MCSVKCMLGIVKRMGPISNWFIGTIKSFQKVSFNLLVVSVSVNSTGSIETKSAKFGNCIYFTLASQLLSSSRWLMLRRSVLYFDILSWAVGRQHEWRSVWICGWNCWKRFINRKRPEFHDPFGLLKSVYVINLARWNVKMPGTNDLATIINAIIEGLAFDKVICYVCVM